MWSDTCHNMHEHLKYYPQGSKTQRDKYCIIPLEVFRIGKFIDTECRIEVSRAWEKREMGNYLMDTEFLFRMVKKFWK